MNETVERGTMQAVYDRLTRLEERGTSRDERMARMEQTLAKMDATLDAVSLEVRDAKTGLRVGLWISNTVWPVLAAGAGWLAHTFWPGK
jgi:hypothetical protein